MTNSSESYFHLPINGFKHMGKGYFLQCTVLLAALGLAAGVQAEPAALNQGQLSCLLEPSKEAELSSEVPGVMRQLKVQRGDVVEKGQVLMTLNSSVEKAALDTARAKLDFARRKVKRNEELYRKNLISDHEQDEMLTEQRLAQFLAKEAQVRLQQRETRSLFAGVVVERLKEPGEFVDDTPFLKVVSLNPLHAEVVIEARYYGQVTRGMPVTLFADGKEEAFPGEVKILDPVIDAASNTFAVTVELDNSEQVLAAGVRCRVEFGTDALADNS